MDLALVLGSKSEGVIKPKLLSVKDNLNIDCYKDIPVFITNSLKRERVYDRVLILSNLVKSVDELHDLYNYWNNAQHKCTQFVYICKADSDEAKAKEFNSIFLTPTTVAILVNNTTVQILTEATILPITELQNKYGLKDVSYFSTDDDDDAVVLNKNTNNTEVEEVELSAGPTPEELKAQRHQERKNARNKANQELDDYENQQNSKKAKKERPTKKTKKQEPQQLYDANGTPYYLDNDGYAYYLDANGTPYYLDENGYAYYLDANGTPYYLDENGYAYYIDENGNPYYVDENGNPYYVDENGNPYYAEENCQTEDWDNQSNGGFNDNTSWENQSNDDFVEDNNSWENQSNDDFVEDNNSWENQSNDDFVEDNNSWENQSNDDFVEDNNSWENQSNDGYAEDNNSWENQSNDGYAEDNNSWENQSNDGYAEDNNSWENQANNDYVDSSTTLEDSSEMGATESVESSDTTNQKTLEIYNDFKDSDTQGSFMDTLSNDVEEIDENLGGFDIASAEESYRTNNEQPKVVTQTVVKEVIRNVGGKSSALANILAKKNPTVILVTGDRNTGITTTALNLTSFFVEHVPTLYFDCDVDNHGLLSYINYAEYLNYEPTKLNSLKVCKSSSVFKNCVCKFEDNLDIMTTDYTCDVTDEEMKTASSVVAEQIMNYGVVIVDCPIDKLQNISELVLIADTVVCVEGSKRGLMNFLCRIESNTLPLRYKKIIGTKGSMFVTKAQKDIDLKKLFKFASDIFEPDGVDWLSMNKYPFNGKITEKVVSAIVDK